MVERLASRAAWPRSARPTTARPGSTSAVARWITRHARRGARAASRRFAAAGVERIMLQDFLPWDLDMIDLAGEVAGRPTPEPPGASGRDGSSAASAAAGRPGRRGGSGRGSCRGPRPDAQVRSWSGPAAAEQRRDRRRRRSGAPGTTMRPPGVSAGRDRRGGVGADDRGRADPERPGRRERLARAWIRSSSAGSRSVRMSTSAVAGAGRRQVAVEERLEVAHRRREPGRLLDLEHQLAGREPVDARRDDQQVRGRRDRAAIAASRARAVGTGTAGPPRCRLGPGRRARRRPAAAIGEAAAATAAATIGET